MYQVNNKSSARQRFFIFWSFVAVVLFTTSCASNNRVAENPKTLFQKAEQKYQSGSYGKSNDLFQTLQNEFPDTEYAKLALLRTADISYRRNELEDAARTYNDFINFNEDHEKAPYAFYQVGMTYYVKRRFAKREFYIGFFYFKQGKFHSAVGRFEYILAHYPGFIDDKVLYYLGLAHLNRGNIEDGHRALLTLTKAYPESPFVPKARPWLDKDEGPGLPLLFMARDYFLTREQDIGDKYVSSTIKGDSDKPRLFDMLSGQGQLTRPQAQEVTFESLYRPVPTDRKREKELEKPISSSAKIADSETVSTVPAEATPALEGAGAVVTEEGSEVASPKPRSQARIGRTDDDPLEVISDWTEADRQKGTITFGGKVVAKQKDMVLYADLVVNYFDMESQKLTKAIAVGNVKLNQADKFVTCERAELIQAERKVILTGNPIMWQGENRVSGERIIIYLNQSQAEVFGGETGKAKVKITPTK